MGIARGSGLRIYYELVGAGRPLVMLHGAMLSGESWRVTGYLEALADAFQLVVVDARGHGRSERPTKPLDYLADRQVEDVMAVLDDLGLESAPILGWSMGGDTALAAAALRPDRVDAVVAIGARGESVGFDDVPRPDATDARRTARRFQKEGMAWMADSVEAAARPALARLIRRADPRAIAAQVGSQAKVKSIGARLAGIDQPMLVVWGEREVPDPPLPFPERARVAVLPGEDHGGAFARVDLVAPEVRRLLVSAPTRPRLEI